MMNLSGSSFPVDSNKILDFRELQSESLQWGICETVFANFLYLLSDFTIVSWGVKFVRVATTFWSSWRVDAMATLLVVSSFSFVLFLASPASVVPGLKLQILSFGVVIISGRYYLNCTFDLTIMAANLMCCCVLLSNVLIILVFELGVLGSKFDMHFDELVD